MASSPSALACLQAGPGSRGRKRKPGDEPWDEEDGDMGVKRRRVEAATAQEVLSGLQELQAAFEQQMVALREAAGRLPADELEQHLRAVARSLPVVSSGESLAIGQASPALSLAGTPKRAERPQPMTPHRLPVVFPVGATLTSEVVRNMPQASNDIVQVNVGGKIFTTRRSTLCAVPGSFLDAMASGRFRLELDRDGCLFIDRSPEYFSQILDWLRDRGAPRSDTIEPRLLHELEYYGLKEDFVGEEPVHQFIYAFGGKNSRGEILSTIEIFDPTSGFWTESDTVPCPLVFAACTAHHSKVYVTGGFSPKALVSELWMFDLQESKWSIGAPMTERRYSHKSIILRDQLYVAGGMRTTGAELLRLSHVERYDPATDIWTDVAPMQQRRFEFAMEVYHNKIYVAGGRDNEDSISNVEIFDADTETWSWGPSIPHSTTNVCLAALNNDLYLVCTTDHTHIYRLNAEGTDWIPLALPPADVPCPSAHVVNGSIYVLDTFDEANFHHPTYLRYHPVSNSWSVHNAGFIRPRNAHTIFNVCAPLSNIARKREG